MSKEIIIILFVKWIEWFKGYLLLLLHWTANWVGKDNSGLFPTRLSPTGRGFTFTPLNADQYFIQVHLIEAKNKILPSFQLRLFFWTNECFNFFLNKSSSCLIYLCRVDKKIQKNTFTYLVIARIKTLDFLSKIR